MWKVMIERFHIQLEKVIIINKFLAFAEANKMIFFETSAKSDLGIKDLFNAIAKKIFEIKNLSDGNK
jgi:hypothetical protein